MPKTFSESYPTAASIEQENRQFLDGRIRRWQLEGVRIEAARVAAEKLSAYLGVHARWQTVYGRQPQFGHYADSRGGVISHCPERDPELA